MIRAMMMGLILIQGLAGQSQLELYGFGMLQPAGGAGDAGAGNIQSLPLSQRHFQQGSIASWHILKSTQLRATVGSGAVISDGNEDRYRAGLTNLQFLVHLTNKSAYGVGLQPVTRVDMGLSDTTQSLIVVGDTIQFRQSRDVTGGLSALQIGYSRKLGRSISAGLGIKVLFGTLTQVDSLLLPDLIAGTDILSWISNPSQRYLVANRKVAFLGRMVTFGMQSGAWPKNRSQVGFQVEWPIAISAKTSSRHRGSAFYTESRLSGLALPSSIHLGYALNMSERQRIVGEWGHQVAAKSAHSDLIFGRHLDEVRTLRLAWARSPLSPSAPNPGKMFYRMGIISKEYYLSDLKNNPLREISFTLGAGIRAIRTGFQIDAALQVGRRDAKPDFPEESFVRLSLSLTTSELWFARPKKKWD